MSARRTASMALALLSVVACSNGGGGSIERVKAASVHAVKSYRFSPSAIEVAAGTAVTWTNDDNFVHNVHLLDGVTKPLPIGGSASITFSEPGLVRFECSLHPVQMHGSVLVT